MSVRRYIMGCVKSSKHSRVLTEESFNETDAINKHAWKQGRCNNKRKNSNVMMDRFVAETLAAHNKFRALHGVRFLTHAPELSEYSQRWADHLAEEADIFEHSPEALRPLLGENIWYGWRSDDPGGTDFPHNVTDAVKSFYDESYHYNYNDPGYCRKTAHFTQLVWRDTKEMGVGWARSKSNNVYLVCNYSPKGNIQGDFEECVPPRH